MEKHVLLGKSYRLFQGKETRQINDVTGLGGGTGGRQRACPAGVALS